MTDGATQEMRLPDAFRGTPVAVDATRLDELLVMTRELARRLSFIGLHGLPEGSWGPLLEHDESVLIARSQTLDLAGQAAGFLDDFSAARPAAMTRRLDELIAWLEDWRRALSQLEWPWARLMAGRAQKVLDEVRREQAEILSDPDPLEAQRRTFFALSKSIEQMAELARGEWAESLENRRHEPAAALLIAFCQMFGAVQARMNAFAGRLTDFYYHDVLRMPAKPPSPDTVHLLFQRDPTYGPPVVIAAGAPFRVDRRGLPALTFVAETELTVTDLKVEALHTLRLQRDAQISPEVELGFVTGARADRFGADVGRDDEARQLSVALFGGDARSAMKQGHDARIGLAISSPVLWLKEGERRITLTLRFDFGDERIVDLLGDLRRAVQGAAAKGAPAAADRAAFSRALGRLFARWVLPEDGFSADELRPTRGGGDREARLARRRDGVLRIMRARARAFIDTAGFQVRRGVVDDGGDGFFEDERFSPTDPLVLWLAPREADYPEESRRGLIRDQVIENLFLISLSTETGWHDIYRPVLSDAPPNDGAAGSAALTLVMGLANEHPAITACSAAVHGEEWPTEAPVMRLRVNKSAGIFPVSLLSQTVLRGVEIAVDVDGVRDVQAYNQLGPLDPTRPFMPFGPLPSTASYLVVGCAELALKLPTRVVLQPEWSGLPPHGFDVLYAGYDEDYGAAAYAISTAILRDGIWAPAAGPPARLFQEGSPPRTLPIAADPGELRSRWRAVPGAFVASPTLRQGLIKLQLATPEGGFGHQAYPTLLTAAVAARAKDKRAAPPPNPPYTPLMERLTLSYSAVARLDVSALGAAKATPGERVLHLHPFGVEEIHPRGAERPHGLIPDLGRDGNLYIALSGREAQGVLTLLFDLRRDAAVDALARQTPRPRLEWSYLAGDQWRRLDERCVLSDTTSGLLTSGIVTLDLPAGLTRGGRVMPGEWFWLRLACDAPSGGFAGLKGVRAQALRATRVIDGAPPTAPLAAGSITLNSAPMPGVLAVEQPEPGFGLRPSETVDQYRARVGERLRHKRRAVTGWDYERLVLDRFPYVHKVRALSHVRDGQAERAPGHVLVVALPDVPRDDPRYSTRPMRLDPLQLAEIEDYLRGAAPPGVTLKVRNASYDLVQVRCRVVLESGADVGDALRRINAGVIAHLSPWHDAGRAALFDWEIRAEEVEACLRALPRVSHVTDLSLIHVWEEAAEGRRGAFRFIDTAAQPGEAVLVRHRQPWSLALPMEEHFIEVDATGWSLPRPTGLTSSAAEGRTPGVQVGRTFVVGGAR